MGLVGSKATFVRKARRLLHHLLALVLTVSSLSAISIIAPPAAKALVNANCTSTVSGLTVSAIASGNDCVLTFTAGTGTWTVPSGVSTASILVVGGGGGGASRHAGGGGAGGVVYATSYSVSGTVGIQVGGGGTGAASAGPGTSGTDSRFFRSGEATTGSTGLIAKGGGYGEFYLVVSNNIVRAGSGGSGGGAGVSNPFTRDLTPGYTNADPRGLTIQSSQTQKQLSGTSLSSNFNQYGNNGGGGGINSYWGGGGGGGAGAAGDDSVASGNSTTSGSTGGAGGIGVLNSITGSDLYYGGGGGGGSWNLSGGAGGLGGGGAGTANTATGISGTANTGGGGGGGGLVTGGSNGAGGAGGSGVVIIRFTAPTPTTPSTPDLAAASDSGVSSTDNTTSVTTPTFTGTATPGSTIQLKVGAAGSEINTGSSCLTNDAGAWSCTSGARTHGSSRYIVTSTYFGSTTTSGALSIYVRTSAGALDPVLDAGSSSTLLANQTAQVNFASGSPLYGFAVGDLTVTGGTLSSFTETSPTRNWRVTFTPTAGTVGTGQITLQANTVTDEAGNNVGASSTLSITYNTNPACSPASVVSGGFTYLAFKSVGNCVWTVPAGVGAVDYLVVGGGGGGGSRHAGAGGAGGLLQGSSSLSSIASLAITVGDGGAGGDRSVSGQNYAQGSNGSSTAVSKATGGGSFTTLTAQGGGAGTTAGVTGGAGGSGGGSLNTGGAGTSGQGNSGGSGFTNNSNFWGGGGGGGAGAGGATAVLNQGGNGGAGTSWTNSGFTTAIATSLTLSNTSNALFAGGGGGGTNTGTAGTGGSGGGGNGTASSSSEPSAGVANTGGGGGGGGLWGETNIRGGRGGSGVVLIRYAMPASTITTPTSGLSGTVGSAYSLTLVSGGGSGSGTYSVTGTLPTGLTLNTSTGVISGTPTLNGTFPITATFLDSNTTSATTSSFSLVIAAAAALTPTFGITTATTSGFTVQISNYSSDYTWAGTATASGSVAISDTGLVTVSGVATETSSTATITTTRTGYTGGSATVSATSIIGAALNPTFGTATSTATGFTVQISNYSSDYTWAGTATASGSVAINGTGLVTVTGVAPGTSSTATITTTRTGYTGGSATVSATSITGAALTPTFGSTTSTATGFTVQISNYNASYTWAGTATASGSVAIDGTGLVTVTGVALGTSSTATITTTRTGYTGGSATVSATSLPACSVSSTTANGYTTLRITSVGNCVWTTPSGVSVADLLVVGGGGGGSASRSGSTGAGGSGGGGGVYAATSVSVSGNVIVTVGAGGAGGVSTTAQTGRSGSQGVTSVFGTLTAGGGGGGGCETGTTNGQPCGSGTTIHGLPGTAGGSGGSPSNFWNAYNYGSPGAATAINGFQGGIYDSGRSTGNSAGSAGGAGGAGSYNAPGAGVTTTFTGSTVYGKGGSSWNATSWDLNSPTANTGSGGNGGYSAAGSATNGLSGAAGIVVIRYAMPASTITTPTSGLSGTVGSAYSITLVSGGGSGSGTFSVTGTLPTGLTLNTSTGVISGTPTLNGTFPLTATFLDSNTTSATTSSFSLVIAAAAALTPAFGTTTATATGFTVQISNYSSDFTWAGTATASGSVAINGTGLVTVTGVAPGTSSTATITTTRTGYTGGSATVSETSIAGAALTPTFGIATSTATGFTVQISNYSASYTWAGTATASGTVAINGTGLITVTGVAPGTSSTATITTTRTGYTGGSAIVSATSITGAALTPTFGSTTSTATGFTVQISNYNASYTWGGTATSSGTVAINGTGLVTVTGVAPGTSSTATITTTRTGYTGGSATVSATSLSACSVSSTTANGYTTLRITSVGSCVWTTPSGVTAIEAIVVGGGGGGGFGNLGGGGGAGEVLVTGSASVSSGTVSGTSTISTTSGATNVVTIGGGGTSGAPSGATVTDANWGAQSATSAAGGNGSATSFGSISATGGGGGGGSYRADGAQGGSGGGAGNTGTGGAVGSNAAPSGWTSLKNSGASGAYGGGGGAGGAGSSTRGGSGVTALGIRLAGGGAGWGYLGSENSLTDTVLGGNGRLNTGAWGYAGTAPNYTSPGIAATGTGGGAGAPGGSGVVIIRYLNAPAITLSTSTISATVGTAITNLTVTNSGGAATYTVSPSLPSGLSINSSTGAVSGTPSATASSTTYTITATNSTGTATSTFSIAVAAGSALTPTFGSATATADGFTVQISNYSASYTWAGTATASGTVAINGTGLVTVTGVAPGTSSTATITTTRAEYTGGSATVSATAIQGTQTITRTSTSPTSPLVSGTYTPTATASSDLSVVITIASGSSSICSIASGVVTFNAAGSCVIQYNQAGNTGTSAAPQVTETLTVSKASQSITFGSLSNRTLGSGTYSISASSSSSLSVAFTSATTSVCTVATTTITLVTAGTCTINANQAGNTNYLAATQVQRSFTIAPALLITTPSGASLQGTYNTTFTSLTIVSSGGAGTNSFSATGSLPTGVSLSSAGVLSGTPSIAGSFSLTVTVTDANGATATTSSFTISIAKGVSTLSISVPAYTFTGSPQGPDSVTTSGSAGAVTFAYAGRGSTTYVSSSTKPTNVGTYTVTATVATDTNFASVSATADFQISNASLVITPTISAASMAYGTSGGSLPTISHTKSPNVSLTTNPTCALYLASDTGFVTVQTLGATLVAGSYVVRCAGAAVANYTITYGTNPSFTVTKIDITLTVGTPASTTYTGSAASVTNSFTRTTGTLAGSDAISGMTYTYTSAGGYNSTTAPTNGGTYTITGSSATFSSGSANNYTITYVAGSLTISTATQTVTWAPTTALLTTNSPATPSTLATALGSATISYAVTSAGATGCTVDSATGVLTFSTAGSCQVTATAAATSNYETASTAVTFVITVPTFVITLAAGTNGSGSNQTLTKTYGVSLTLPDSTAANGYFTRTGYTVSGWSTSNGGSETHARGGSFTTDAATTFYPVWTANGLTVTYDSKSGSAVSNGTVNAGASISAAPTAPTRAGYTFGGWSATDGGAAVTFPYAHGQTADFTLFAKWSANSLTVTYDSKSGSAVSNGTVNTAASISLAPTAPTRAGYAFGGWSATDTGTAVTFPHAHGQTADFTLYAVWSANSLTVSYDSQSGSAVTSGAVNTGASISAAPTAPTRTGYTFTGWSTTTTGSVVTFPYAHGQTANFTLYAIWSANALTITYDSKSGSAVSNGTVNTAASISAAPTAPTRAGYTFAGWSATDGGTAVTFPFAHGQTADFTLFAKWSANALTITYNSQGGSAVTSGSVNTAASISAAPTAPTRTGYTFAGWSATDTGTAVTFPHAHGQTADFTLFAKWSANALTITYNSQGGSAVTSGSVNTAASISAAPTAPTRAGYAFAGWSATDTGTAVTFPHAHGQTTDFTLFAKWSANALTITYDSKSGSAVSNGIVNTGASISVAPTPPTRTGYTFGGWSATDTGTAVTFPHAHGQTADFTLFAKWSGNTNTITYDSKGGAAVSDGSFVTGGSIAAAPTEPIRAGYTLVGWSLTDGGSIISYPYSPPGTSGITLYAIWTGIACSPTSTTTGGYTIYTFATAGTCFWSVPVGVTDVEILAVAGGGGGGYAWDNAGAGGGAGGQVKTGAATLGSILEVTVGAGGTAGTVSSTRGGSGGNSSASTIIALGGTGGCAARAITCSNSAQATSLAAANGGVGGIGGASGRGGGGSNTAGTLTSTTAGGTGTASNYSGTSVTYGVGGTGGTARGLATNTNIVGAAGSVNTGNGGGGASAKISSGEVNGGVGGAGLLVVRIASALTITFDSQSGSAVSDGSTFTGASIATAPTEPTRSNYTFLGWFTATTGGSAITFPYEHGQTANFTLFAQWTLNTYSIVFNANSGLGLMGNQTITHGVATNLNANLYSRANYVFYRWATAADGTGTTYNNLAEITLTAGTTLYAQWTANTYVVTFNYNGGNGGDSTATASFTTAGSPITLPVPTKTGFSFAGWHSDAALATQIGTGVVNRSYSPTGGALSLNAYAKWEADNYTFTYNSNSADSGSVPTESSKQITQTATVKANTGNLVRVGYTFSGWNIASDGTGTNYLSGSLFTVGSDDVILFAKWSPNTYTVTYNINGGTGNAQRSSANVTSDTYTTDSSPVVFPGVGTLTRSGYTFGGWNTSAAGTGTNYVATNTYTTVSNVIFYAKWNPVTYTITYNGNQNTGGTTPTAGGYTTGQDSPYAVLSNSFTKTLNVFGGWNTADNGTGSSYSPGASITTLTDIVLYAVWIPQFTLHYAINGGSVTSGSLPGDQLYNTGTSVGPLFSAVSRTGYTFDGWVNGSTTIVPNGNFTILADSVLTAKWTPINYTISYNSDGGSEAPESTTRQIGQSFTVDSAVSKPGYNFAGWATGSTVVGPDAVVVMGSANIAYTARWVARVYTISFDWNGGRGTAVEDVNYTFGTTAMTLPLVGDRVKDGFTFAGWSETSTGSLLSATYIPSRTRTLIARWTIGNFTITYNLSGGTLANASVAVQNGSPTVLPLPTRTNFVFDGWHTATTGGSRLGVNGDSFTPTASQTVYARWIQSSLYGISNSLTRIGSVVTVANIGNTFSGANSNSSVLVSVPENALPAGTTINFDLVGNSSRATGLLPNVSYLISIAISWITADGLVPDTVPGKPISVTISNETIKIGATAYAIVNNASTLLGTATQDRTITIALTSDPEVVIAAVKPSAPLNVTATSNGHQQSVISWSAPSTNGGSDINSYTVTSNTSATCTTTTSSCTISSLAHGTAYTFTVTATNNVGTSDASTSASATTAALYTVAFNAKSGTPVANGSFLTASTVSEPTAPTRAGYSFAGWSATDGGSAIGFPYAPGVTSNITLFARWDALDNAVTFNSKGGSTVSSSVFSSGGTVAEPTAPTRAGFTFAGWSATDTGTAVTFPYAPGVVTDITLYAKWTEIVQNNSGGSSAPAPVTPSVPVPVVPVKSNVTVVAPITVIGDKDAKVNAVEVAVLPIGSTAKPPTIKIDKASEKFIAEFKVVSGKLVLTPETGFSGKRTVTVTISENAVDRIVQIPITVLPEEVTKPTVAPVSATRSTIRWAESPNATSYTVYLEGKKVCSTTGTSCNVNKILGPRASVEIVSNGGDKTLSEKVEADFKPADSIILGQIVSPTFTKVALTDVDVSKLDKIASIIKAQGFKNIFISEITTTKKTAAMAEARIALIKKYLRDKVGSTSLKFEVKSPASRTSLNIISVKA